ncbi:hypothetical protein RJT34_18368 [Clitoria ternatea]|uniref:Tf2-1-like SH3-like domain-containing protein n=1 Tax=Clitoria ternatea TaxID=43366 RepID=A0AAN9PFD3_CLITE
MSTRAKIFLSSEFPNGIPPSGVRHFLSGIVPIKIYRVILSSGKVLLDKEREASNGIREKMKIAQDRQKSYYDSRHRSLEFQTGDWIFLKVSLTKGVGRILKSHKLNPRYIGPYQILWWNNTGGMLKEAGAGTSISRTIKRVAAGTVVERCTQQLLKLRTENEDYYIAERVTIMSSVKGYIAKLISDREEVGAMEFIHSSNLSVGESSQVAPPFALLQRESLHPICLLHLISGFLLPLSHDLVFPSHDHLVKLLYLLQAASRPRLQNQKGKILNEQTQKHNQGKHLV